MNTTGGSATYDDKICKLRVTLEMCGHTNGTTSWVKELIKHWFGFPVPHDQQAECSNLIQKKYVFLTAPTGSG